MANQGLIGDIHSDDGLEPAGSSSDGDAESYGRAFPAADAHDAGVDMFVWVAEPGTYAHEPGDAAESSLIVAGEAEVEIQGYGTYTIKAGNLFSIPPGAPGEVRVKEKLRALVIAPRLQQD